MPPRRDFTAVQHAVSYDFISPLGLDLTGKHVLITGAAWDDGVGFAAATAFARAGASGIAIVDLHGIDEGLVERLQSAAADAGRVVPNVITAQVDIADRESVTTLAENIKQAFNGRLDILVNNAAHQEPYQTILESDPDVYWRTWEVNVGCLFNMARAFLPLLIAQQTSVMINLASSGALSVRAGSASYRTSKLAVMRWTEALQLEHEKDGLLALAVNPGAIRTQMTINEPDHIRDRLPHKPEIAGDTIAWLAAKRPELGWLGGRYVSCPWDMEELVSRKDEIVEGDKLKVRMVI